MTLRMLRTNPRTRRNPLASREEQVKYLKGMGRKAAGRHPSDVGSKHGLHLAEHFVFGVMKKTPRMSIMTGLEDHKAKYEAEGWTPDEHLALVALGLMESHRLNDITQEFLMTEFLRYVGEMLGDEQLGMMDIMGHITRLKRLA